MWLNMNKDQQKNRMMQSKNQIGIALTRTKSTLVFTLAPSQLQNRFLEVLLLVDKSLNG